MQLPKGKLLALVAAFLAIGLVAGTGAFTTVSAERTATVSVSGDDAALLGLVPVDGNDYASLSNGVMEISLENINLEAETKIAVVFSIVNNGDEEVAVSITNNDYANSNSGDGAEGNGHEDAVHFVVNATELDGDTPNSALTQIGYGAADEDVYSLNDNTIDIGSGERVGVGMYIDTTGMSGLDPDSNNDDANDLIDEITITADADDVDDNDESDTDNLDAADN